MAKFIVCRVSEVSYRDSVLVNSPVNIDLCTSIISSRLAYYPDNTGIPSLDFKGCDCKWVFSTESDRDAELNKILEHH